jgi:hypothetical protein
MFYCITFYSKYIVKEEVHMILVLIILIFIIHNIAIHKIKNKQ